MSKAKSLTENQQDYKTNVNSLNDNTLEFVSSVQMLLITHNVYIFM